MIEITDGAIEQIAEDYGATLEEVTRYRELLSESHLITDSEALQSVLIAATDVSRPTIMPEGLGLPEVMNKPLSDSEVLTRALEIVFEGVDDSLVAEDVEAMIEAFAEKENGHGSK